MRYALVTPARNELENLERLAAAVVAQELTPAAWMIVDDGSDDGTSELAAALVAEHPWIHVVGRERDTGELAGGRRRGRALEGFKRGVTALREPVDIVVKVDADTSFDPDYFRRLVERFEAEPDLGIAGGACYEIEGGEWVRQKVVKSHPRGASRAYRWALVDDVLALEPRMGWDGLDEVKAQMRGYRSATILELGFRHHRATGAREPNRMQHQQAQGHAAWYMGYRPGYLLLRTAYRSLRDPSAVGMILGYAKAAAAREDRCADRDAVRHLRSQQRLLTVLRRGAPP
jgi:glycosyltransferase involved in cell wall biosynthesis